MAELDCSIKDPVLLSDIIHGVVDRHALQKREVLAGDRESPDTSSEDSLTYSEVNVTTGGSMVRVIHPLEESDSSDGDDEDEPFATHPLAKDNIDTLYASLSQIISSLNLGIANTAKENTSLRDEFSHERDKLFTQVEQFKQTAVSLRTQLLDIRSMLVQMLNTNMQTVKRDIQRLQSEIYTVQYESKNHIQDEVREAVRAEMAIQTARQNDFIKEATTVLDTIRDKLSNTNHHAS